MLQFLSTLSPPRRFGQPPDSRRMISPSFSHVCSGHPASAARAGSHKMSPCVNTIAGDFLAFEGVADKCILTVVAVGPKDTNTGGLGDADSGVSKVNTPAIKSISGVIDPSTALTAINNFCSL